MATASDSEDGAVTVVTEDGWSLGHVGREAEPRVLDVHLGEHLGQARPVELGGLIERLLREGRLEEDVRRGHPAQRWLTEDQAVTVLTHCEAAAAAAILDPMRRAFMRARRRYWVARLDAGDDEERRAALREAARQEVARLRAGRRPAGT